MRVDKNEERDMRVCISEVFLLILVLYIDDIMCKDLNSSFHVMIMFLIFFFIIVLFCLQPLYD